MKLQGRYTFDAPREAVWKALNDPEVLARTLPGCERLEEKEPNVYSGALNIQVGPVSGLFQGTVKLHDLEENRGYRMDLDGQGAPGFVQGKGTVTLEDAAGEEGGDGVATVRGATVMVYDLDTQVGGRIAGVGQRLLDSSAKVITRQALEGLEVQIASRLEAPAEAAGSEPTDAEGSAAGEVSESSQSPGVVAPPAPAAPTQTQFAARFARGLFEELVPAPWRPVVIGGGVLLLLAVVFFLVRACSA